MIKSFKMALTSTLAKMSLKLVFVPLPAGTDGAVGAVLGAGVDGEPVRPPRAPESKLERPPELVPLLPPRRPEIAC